MTALAVSRADIAGYVSALFYVYFVIIFLYILVGMMLSMGLRLPYSRLLDAVMTFLRDVSEPYLRLFRRFIPMMGMFDFSPMVALIVLWAVRYGVVRLIAG